jgi:hypothetical protein
LIAVPMAAVILNGRRRALAWLPVVAAEVILVGRLDVAGAQAESRLPI